MIFHPDFRLPFTLGGEKFFVASLTPADRAHIKEGLKFMSAESIRNRFMGSKKDFTDKELDYLTSLDGRNHYALGVEEAEGAHRGVAVIRMVRSESTPSEAEVAVTIIDEYQKIGLGSFLLDLLALAAMERNVSEFSFTFLPTNEGIIRLIQKKGSPKSERSSGTIRMVLSLKNTDEKALRARVRSILPAIDNGHSRI
jgi:acetyltransferase